VLARLTLIVVSLFIAGTVLSGSVLAGPRLDPGKPDNPHCWGAVTSQRASTEHDVGEHASNPPFDTTPDRPGRAGLGNPPEGIDHVSDLGTLLATIDGLESTHCP
jgi:hypothetical protein